MPLDSTAAPPTDEQLVSRAQQGCSASFEELVRRYQVPLLQFLRRWATHEDAEDLVQDALVRAYRNLHRYRPSWRFSTWLFTIARRLSMNLGRRRVPRADCEVAETVVDDAPLPGELVAEEENRQCLWSRAAEVLTEPQMTATWLHYVEDMSVKQIARVLGRSQIAAKAMLFRARKKLLPILQELEPNGPAGHRITSIETTSCPTAGEPNHG